MDMLSQQPIRVGLVDDDPVFLEQVSNLLDLRPDMACLRLSSSDELEHAFRVGDLDCVVIDYNLGNESGLNLHLSLSNRYKTIPPFILMSGVGCEKTVVRAFRSGFADYVSKRHFSIEELCGSIRRVVGKARALDDAAEQDVSSLTNDDTDELTGLFRPQFMDRRLSELLADRRSRHFAMIGIRISGFEEIRAEIGYVRAERIAHQFASTLKQVCRSIDIAGHWSEHEWMVLLDARPTPDDLAGVVERLKSDLRLRADFDGLFVDAYPEICVAEHTGETKTRQALLEAAFPERPRESSDCGSAGLSPALIATNGSAQSGDGGEHTPSSLVTSIQERRDARRRRVIKRGQLVYGSHGLTIMCKVRDQSPGGARLSLDSWVAAPKSLELRIIGSDFRKRAQLRWQKGMEIGIQFDEMCE